MVTATNGCTPSSVKVRRSDWMPAPPPESDPAIVSTRSGVLVGGASGRNFTASTLTEADVHQHRRVIAGRADPVFARLALVTDDLGVNHAVSQFR